MGCDCVEWEHNQGIDATPEVGFESLLPAVARCCQCGFWVSQERGASCIDWCAVAKECIGLAKYERLMKSRPPDTTAEENTT